MIKGLNEKKTVLLTIITCGSSIIVNNFQFPIIPIVDLVQAISAPWALAPLDSPRKVNDIPFERT